jgi:transposase
MGGDRAASAEEPAWRASGRRPAGDLGHPACAEDRLPLAGLPGRLRSGDYDLQPLQQVVATAVLAEVAGGPGDLRRRHQEHGHRLHLRQGPALGLRRKRGAKAQAIGPSRGGQTTKVHALTDTIGRPFVLTLTPGNVSDVTAAPDLLTRAGKVRYVLADKGYDADALRRIIRTAGAVPVIPGRINRKRAIAYDKHRYRERYRIENAFGRIKDFRRVATRYDKLALNFLSAVALAVLLAFWI